jgi:hypothetical protein
MERNPRRMKLFIGAGDIRFEVELRDTATAKALVAAAPFVSRAQTWGEEVYFSTPVKATLEPDAQQTVDPGTVCFWIEGDALALPFGRTPISTDERPKLASRCNLVGRVVGDPRRLAAVKSAQEITVEGA